MALKCPNIMTARQLRNHMRVCHNTTFSPHADDTHIVRLHEWDHEWHDRFGSPFRVDHKHNN